MTPAPPQRLDSRGLLLAVTAYLLWGAFPFYFAFVDAAAPLEIIGHRIFWTFLFCLTGLFLVREWRHFREVVASPKLFWGLALAGVLVSANWLIYVWGVLNHHIVDTALGYFINPLFTVLLAVFVLGEKLRKLQTAAMLVGLAAVVVIIIGYGQFPWVALSLATTFSLYGLLKKKVGGKVTPLAGLTVETTLLAPLALGYLIWLQASGASAFLAHGPLFTLGLAMAGAVTAIPLLLFAAASARLPLSVIGFIQYLTPIIQFAIGVWLNHETMPPARWAGFALVWVAVVLLTGDSLRTTHRIEVVEPEVVN